MVTKESLTEEIIQNARKDRKRLELVADSLITKYDGMRTEGLEGEGPVPQLDGKSLDSEVAAVFAEEISKLSDSLTKVNQQLVEIVKVESRRPDPELQPPKLKKGDVDEVYDEIQPQEVN